MFSVVVTSFKSVNEIKSDDEGARKGWPEVLCTGDEAVLQQLDAEMLLLNTWEFKTHVVATLVGGRTLSCVGWRVFAEWDFVAKFNLNRAY